jgi:hypothetical protein
MTKSAKDVKSEFFKIGFFTNTFIGFDQNEIEKTSDEDLILIRKDIYSYLTNPKLKKRNSNFKTVFYRINKELSKRKREKVIKNSNNEKIDNDSDFSQKSQTSNKLSNSIIPFKFNIQIPEFLNDKDISYSGKAYKTNDCECQNCKIKRVLENSIKHINECKIKIY